MQTTREALIHWMLCVLVMLTQINTKLKSLQELAFNGISIEFIEQPMTNLRKIE